MKRWIVELERNVWICSCTGDPGRTLVKENAKEFKSMGEARNALIEARGFRPFKNAKILEKSEEI